MKIVQKISFKVSGDLILKKVVAKKSTNLTSRTKPTRSGQETQ